MIAETHKDLHSPQTINDEMAPSPLMRLSDVIMRFGPFTALNDLSFDIKTGEILGVAGPNGAGKSTLLNVCTGGLSASAGRIAFRNTDITKSARHACCKLGIARTFQIPTVLSSLTVGENVFAGATFGEGSDRIDFNTAVELAGLHDDLSKNAGQADLLTRKRIMLASALATGPQIIFMDEPLGGLNAEEIDSFCSLILHIREELSLTFVIVEHKIRALSRLSDRILILNFGEEVCLDEPDIVVNDQQVIDIYLGKRRGA